MHEHSHGARLRPKDSQGRTLLFTIVLNLIIPVCQIVGGLAAGSMAVVSDAVHNFSDCAGLLLAFGAYKLGKKGPSTVYSFGLGRAEVLAALINTAILVGACLFLLAEAFARLKNPQPVSGLLVVILAGVGLAGNGLSVVLLKKDAADNLNIRGAFLHMLGDLLTSAAVLVNGAVLMLWPVYWLDPLLTVVIVAFIVKSGWGVAREALRIVMEGVPEGMDLVEIQRAMEEVEGVDGVHHLHAWTVGSQGASFSCHVMVSDRPLSETVPLSEALKEMLHERFGIDHAALEFETAQCEKAGLLCPRRSSGESHKD